MRDAVFTASPHTSYEKRVSPITPAVAGPQWMPTRSLSLRRPSGGWRGDRPPNPTRGPRDRTPHPRAPRAAATPPRRHVAFSDLFDLVDLISFAELIECAHEPIKKVD